MFFKSTSQQDSGQTVEQMFIAFERFFDVDGGAVNKYEITLQIFRNVHSKWKKDNKTTKWWRQPCMPHQTLFVKTALK